MNMDHMRLTIGMLRGTDLQTSLYSEVADCVSQISPCGNSETFVRPMTTGAQPTDEGSTTVTEAPPAVGIDPEFSDCVIKVKSGKIFYTSKGVLATCSPVFRGRVECCGQRRSSIKIENPLEPASDNDDSTPIFQLEIPLEDPEEEIATLVEHLHQPERFLQSVVPVVTKEGTARVLLLAPIAFKYDMQGILRQIEAVLAPATSLTNFISHHENGAMLATWGFACRYRFEPVLKEVEARIQSELPSTLGSLKNAQEFVANLPSSSLDLACSSLLRLLHKRNNLAMLVRETSIAIRNELESIRHYGYDISYSLDCLQMLENAVDVEH